ncbi:uncharacterized protein KY384_005749 [Bacidia gigantensis]|uniref:uncharacterized protein n=1 Tax=Bacidia gigantensis TaxID=2732470 RepID=UPI001D05334A|nr:uncharacterized protein KY384_005749 [Bacidia gigantensis]KAG8529114.1 hypothetical protein KY384_005749 [Bacidia gigantensis]
MPDLADGSMNGWTREDAPQPVPKTSPQPVVPEPVPKGSDVAVKPPAGSKQKRQGSKYDNIQQIILHFAGNEGAEQCDEISSPVCQGTGLDFNLCMQHPEAHFVFFAITHFANWLHKLQNTFTYSTVAAGLSTATLVKQFFTPQVDPSTLVLPVAIINGLFGALSLGIPAATLGSSAATIVSGVLTQKGLTAVDPLVQWGEVQTAVGKLYQSVTIALDQYFDSVLKTLPQYASGAAVDYFNDPVQLPSVLKDGHFASNVDVGSINPNVFGAVVSPAINSLWVQDRVAIFKITDHAYNRVDHGKACSFWPDQTVCSPDGGTAYIFARWINTPQPRERIPALDTNKWHVWGTSDKGEADDGTKNANHLTEYALSLDIILQSAIKQQAKHGYLYSNTQQDTLDQLTNDPGDITEADLASWTIPICDIDAILKAHGKTYIGAEPVGTEFGYSLPTWAMCTCVQAEGWPTDKYPYENPIANPECSPGWG